MRDAAEERAVLDGRLLPAALGCWGATVAVLVVGWSMGLVLAAGLGVVGVGVWRWARGRERWRGVAWVVLATVGLGVGFAVATAWRVQWVQVHPLRDAVGSTVRVVIVPADDPKVMRGSAFGGGERWLVRGEVREFERSRMVMRAGGAVVVVASGAEWGRVVPGQAVQLRARVEAPWRRDLTVVSLRATGPPETVGELPWWQRIAKSVRGHFADAAGRALADDAAGLLPALVLGDTSRLPAPVREDFEIAGLQHLCVVSGANFTILLSVVLFLARVLTLGPRVGAAVAAVALALFVVIARPDPSVLRAAAMGAITLLALVTGRRKQALPALCAAVIGLLAIWPELAVQPGFALSVVATGGLILLAPSWADWLRAKGWWRLPAEIVAVSAGAFVVTVPIMVALTGRISVLAVLANVLVAPVIAPITVIGAAGAASAWVWPALAELVLRTTAPPLWWLLTVAERTAALPGASIAVPGGVAGGLVAAALVAILVWAFRSALVRRTSAAVLLGVAAVLVPLRIWHPGWPPEDWVLAVCDVGQGDGLALSLGNHHAVVIDVGPDPRPIRTCLNRLRITHVPLLVLTHPHSDHIGGLPGALQDRTVATLATGPYELPPAHTDPPGQPCPADVRQPLAAHGVGPASTGARVRRVELASPGGSGDSCDSAWVTSNSTAGRADSYRRAPVVSAAGIAETARRSGITTLELTAGLVFDWGAVKVEVLAPAARAAAPDLDPDAANDRSVVLAATTSAGRILLTGDIEAPAQRWLLASGANLRADILKVPHHGSRTTTREFLTATRPRLALISAGTDNTFGHPHPGILAELSALGAAVARTDRQGDIVVGPGPDLRIVTTGARRR
ncbi:ComEC/Rec2 family competence protein [Nocardia sp. NPDC127579]|uniref:ComEC/Rec2 family competence protein n=1 Tax=Nocardia sp. NPDC127579 TaxID=3345402 RepID=UPI0036344488